jgi:hypothetical protein
MEPWPSCAVSASQLRCNGLSGLSARSPAWARARLSRKATSAPSGADSMIVLIASFTSAKSPVWTANISSARRSYTSEGRSAPLTNTPSQVHVHRRGGRNHAPRESGLPGLRGRGQGAQPRQVPGPPQRGRDGRRAPWPLVNGRTKAPTIPQRNLRVPQGSRISEGASIRPSSYYQRPRGDHD